MFLWHKITFVGDSVVLLPAGLVILAWLAAGHAWRLALLWSALFASGLVVVLATKIAFIGWGIGIESLDFTGVSGHAMRASAIFPVIAWLFLQRSSGSARNLGILVGVGLGLLVTVSRVVLHYHSVSEAVSGWMLGSVVALLFIRVGQGLAKPQLNRWLIALAMLGLLPTSYAEPAPTSQWMNTVALYLSGHDRPYVRSPAGFVQAQLPPERGPRHRVAGMRPQTHPIWVERLLRQ
ncbi:MAG: rane-associated phospholipid phosphatase [Herminiimonas sp.]|nr:rane-associated phospholipid phosphatase [Herminiimonas sp.]MDB5852183.1 rane-associated phospholipid phosphatase [Herminiimonas sp.]